jgi:hypothetical protein
MSTIRDLAERLKSGGEYIVYPKAMGDVPVELPKMAKYDEDGEIVGYYSINELSRELGRLLTPLPFTDTGSLMFIRWSFDKKIVNDTSDEEATRKILGDADLNDITNESFEISELVGDEYGIFGSYEFKQLLKNKLQ